ncbi:hypothetical protein, partial [Klebsiella pneumoniae]|uniref:hypothetical protein n=1 Tax=Klebsiella pneumoniae TaxID=573 RepID=UPI001B8B46D7
LDAVAVLRNLAGLPTDGDHVADLTRAWPLAWKGWLTIECILTCSSNSIPPRTAYRIRITSKGRAVLAGAQEEAA